MPRRPSLFAQSLNLALFGAVLGPEVRRAPPRAGRRRLRRALRPDRTGADAR